MGSNPKRSKAKTKHIAGRTFALQNQVMVDAGRYKMAMSENHASCTKTSLLHKDLTVMTEKSPISKKIQIHVVLGYGFSP